VLRRWCIGNAALGLGALLFASPAAAAPEAEPESGAADAGDEADAGTDEDVDGDDAADEDVDGDAADDGVGDDAEADPAAEAGDPIAAPMVEVIPKDKKVRHDWYVGFGLGSGVGFGSVEAGNTLGLDAISGVKVASSGFIHGGGRLREKVYLGARIANLTGGPAGGTSLMAEALFFPIKERGLLLGVAVGPSVLYAVSTDDSMGPSGMRQNGRPAIGVAADIAYDFWILRRFNLGIVLQGNGALNPKQAMIFGTTLGLQFNWY
jgi:hypothetical protein